MVSNSGVEVARADVVGEPGVAGAAAGVERREVELLVVGVEVEEQFENLVEDFGGAGVGAVDLVDDDDRPEAERERLAGDELGLRHRPFGGVDQQDHAVDHRQDALDLGAEIGVAGRVDDVDVGAVPVDRRALGEDGDPALLLEVGRIHRPLLDALVVAEGAGLAEQLVDQRGLAVIDVGDDRHVAEFHGLFSGKRSRLPSRKRRYVAMQHKRVRARAGASVSVRGFRPRARSRAARCGRGGRAWPRTRRR